MSFDADWLSLREPHDARSRARAPLAALSQWADRRGGLGLLDLGCGTGSTLRFLAPCLGNRAQRWTLVDHDPALLAAVSAPDLPAGVQVETQQRDLARELDRLPWESTDLLTGSALIDLVSKDWIEALAQRCAAAGTAVYMSLSFTGTAAWLPRLAGDDAVVAAINRHQRQDKGFGPALGPDAHRVLADALHDHGYRVVEGTSDWSFGPADAAIQERLITDWSDAAASLADPPTGLDDWREARLSLVHCGRFYIGHACLFAALPDGGSKR